MKTNIKVIIGVLALVVIGVGVYFTNPQGQKGLVRVRIRRLPDLIAASLTVSPPTGATGVTAGQTATVRVKIGNIGTASSAASTTRFKINGIEVSSVSTGALAARSGTEVETYSWTPAAAGSYTVEACADATRAITELNETNNCPPIITVTVAAPPTCTATQYTCGRWDACSLEGSQAGLDCTINSGLVCTLPSSITRACTPPPPECTVDQYACTTWSECSATGSQIGSDCTGNSSIACTPPTAPTRACTPPPPPDCMPDQYTCASWGECSASGLQPASECTANPGIACTLPISVQRECTPPLPDLVIEDINIINQEPNGMINFRVRVRNAGNAPVTSTSSSLMYMREDTIDSAGNIVLGGGGGNALSKCSSVNDQGLPRDCTYFFTIAPGEIITTFAWSRGNNPDTGQLSVGGVGIRLTVDSTRTVTESDETNNSLDFMVPSSYLTFRPTNLIVLNARIVSSNTDGLYANFAATIENLGTNNVTTPFPLSLFIDVGSSSSGGWVRHPVDSVPVRYATSLQSGDYAVDMTIPDLAGLSSREESMQWDVSQYGPGGPTIGSHTFTVCVNLNHNSRRGGHNLVFNYNLFEINEFDNCSPIQEFIL